MKKNKLVEGKYSTGAVKAPLDKRDYIYDDHVALSGAIKIDWDKGYDIREEMGGDIPFKNQFSSSSCVGQGWSYYIWVKQVIEMMNKFDMTLVELWKEHLLEINEISAKAIYSQIYLNNGGAYIYKGGKLAVDWGAVCERVVPSYKGDGSTNEQFMRDKNWLTENISRIAEIFKGKEYKKIVAKDNMDLFAQAILQNDGVVGGVAGQNGRGWNTEFPQPPVKKNKIEWSHCIYYGAFGKDEKGKYIATPNSWGRMDWNKDYKWKSGDKPGSGWQKLYENYFTNDFQFDPWLLVDQPNLNNLEDMNNFVRIVKDEDSKAVGFFVPAITAEAIKNLSRVYDKEVPMKEDGSINWAKFIEGSVKLEEPLEE